MTFVRNHASLFDREPPCLEVRDENLATVGRKLEEATPFDIDSVEFFLRVLRAIRLEELHPFGERRDAQDATL